MPDTPDKYDDDAPEVSLAGEDIYRDLRLIALNTSAAELGLTTDSAYGVVIDIEVGGGFITFTALATGDASMYTSGGGGVIGGYAHETVRTAAIALVDTAAKHIDDMTVTSDATLPAPDELLLYVLTPNGRYRLDDSAENFFTASGPNADLFIAANELLTELRLIDENR